jgi:hypothetical protein
MNSEDRGTERGLYSTGDRWPRRHLAWYLMPAIDRKERRPALVGMGLAVRHV